MRAGTLLLVVALAAPAARTLEALGGLGTPVAAAGRVRLEEPL